MVRALWSSYLIHILPREEQEHHAYCLSQYSWYSNHPMLSVTQKRLSDSSSVLLLQGPETWFNSSSADCLHESLLFPRRSKDMVRPASLTLAVPKSTSPVSSNITSPTDVGSSTPSPRDATAVNKHAAEAPVSHHDADEEEANSPDFTSLPPFPSSPKDIPKHAREPSKGFFSNLKASKSSNKVHHVEPTIRKVSEESPMRNVETRDNQVYRAHKGPGSTPDLSHSMSADINSVQGSSGKYLPPITEM